MSVAPNYTRRPWTGRIKGEDIPWGHYKISFEGKEVLLDECVFSRFNTWEPGYDGDDSSGIRIDDLLEMLPRILTALRNDGWRISPPGSRVPVEPEYRDNE